MQPMKAIKASGMWQRALLVTGIGVLAAGSVAGVSFALTGSTSPAAASPAASSGTHSSSTKASAKASGPRQKALQVLRRSVHGDVEIATKNGFETFQFDRGVVTSISSSSVTVLRPDSKSVTEAISSTTHMPKRGSPAKGQNVVVISAGGKASYIVDVGAFHGAPKASASSSTTGASSTT